MKSIFTVLLLLFSTSLLANNYPSTTVYSQLGNAYIGSNGTTYYDNGNNTYSGNNGVMINRYNENNAVVNYPNGRTSSCSQVFNSWVCN